MNEISKIHLQRIADDERLLECLKNTLLSAVDANDLIVISKKNEQLGEEVRALLQARELVSKGIDEIKTLQTPKVGKSKINIAIKNYG